MYYTACTLWTTREAGSVTLYLDALQPYLG
jgi:hypothetical protein